MMQANEMQQAQSLCSVSAISAFLQPSYHDNPLKFFLSLAYSSLFQGFFAPRKTTEILGDSVYKLYKLANR